MYCRGLESPEQRATQGAKHPLLQNLPEASFKEALNLVGEDVTENWKKPLSSGLRQQLAEFCVTAIMTFLPQKLSNAKTRRNPNGLMMAGYVFYIKHRELTGEKINASYKYRI